MKKNWKKILISLSMAFAMLFFAACDYSDTNPVSEGDEEQESAMGNIGGIKSVYRPASASVVDFYENFALDIMRNLAFVFGNASISVDAQNEVSYSAGSLIHTKYQEYKSNFNPEDVYLTEEAFKNNLLIHLVDDIRGTISAVDVNAANLSYNITKNSDTVWNWTHDIEGTNTYSYDVKHNIKYAKTYFKGYTNANRTAANALGDISDTNDDLMDERINYYEFYAQTFAGPMQVVVLQVLLDRTPTIFTYNKATNSFSPSAESVLGNETSGLIADYKKYANYLGVTEDDKVQITNYILDNVIGSQKFANKQNTTSAELSNFHLLKDRNAYKEVIEEVIWKQNLAVYHFSNANNEVDTNLGSLYNVFPVAEIRDYNTNSFFIASTGATAFAHIPAAEYKSISLLTNKDGYLWEAWFYIAASGNFNIKYFYRYFDAEKDIFYESSPVDAVISNEATFSHQKAEMNILSFNSSVGKNGILTTRAFNNDIADGILKAPQPKLIDFETSQYFEYTQGSFAFSKNKMQALNQSFFELVFVVDKSNPEIKDYNFKVGLAKFFAPPNNMIPQ